MVIEKNLDILQQIHSKLGEITPQKFVDAQGRKITVKEAPKIEVYHLQYDAKGRVIDYHIDRWPYDATENLRKLERRYPDSGLTVWSLQKPDMEKPSEDISCRHPRCPRYFRTIEERETHVQAQHREFYRSEQERMTRESATEQNRLLASQLEVQKLQIETLSRLLAERSITASPAEDTTVSVQCIYCERVFNGKSQQDAENRLRMHQRHCKLMKEG